MDLVFLVGDFGVSSAYSGGVGTVVFVIWIFFRLQRDGYLEDV